VKLGQDRYSLLDLHNFVREAQEVSTIWRPESWTAEEFVDGQQYTSLQYDELRNAGIDPLTINRIFPTVNLLLGLQIVNKFNTGAKGRTHKDSEIGQLMSEGIQFINDQSGTEFLVTQAYRSQIVPGIGWLMLGHDRDPRREKIRVSSRDWKEMWWDPYASPWLDPDKCRYVFHQPWMDIEALMDDYPDKREELEVYSHQVSDGRQNSAVNIWYDEAQQVEDLKGTFGGRSRQRRRVRPVEMWYPVSQKSLWAKFRDQTAREIPLKGDVMEAFAMVQAADEVVWATVRRMWTTSFLDNIVLYDGPSPFNHDYYPFVPFVGYLDRFGFPYGVPQQLKGQQIEVNKRRSMTLALLQKRRVVAESDVVPEGATAKTALEHLYEEANKLDGFMVVAPGKSGAFTIQEGIERGALQAQVLMLHESEREIKEISGANDEQAGYKGQALSGVAQEKRQAQSSIILAPLAENLRRSKRMLGLLQVAEIQGQWTGERVLRVTDRATGAEKYVSLNERVFDQHKGTYVVRNNVTQGMFDVVVTEAPPTDTVREQNMNLLIEWAKKAPPEMTPHIMLIAMDLSGLPNKDMLMEKLKEIVGVRPGDEDMSEDERKQRIIDTLERHAQQAKEEAAFQQQLKGFALEKVQLENDLLRAQIDSVRNGDPIDIMKVKVAKAKADIDGFRVGAEVADRARQRQAEQMRDYQQGLTREEKGATA